MARFVQNANVITAPAWAGDYFERDHMIPGGAKINAALWQNVDYTITVTEPATAGAVSLTVAALPVAIPANTILDFSGTGELVRVTTDAAVGATTLTVEAIDAAIEDNDTATYTVTDAVPVSVPSGTAIGRTFAERDNGDAFGPAAATDDEIYLTCFDVLDATVNPDVELYRPGSVVKENFLPQVMNDTMIAGVLDELRARYICTTGAA